MTRLLVAASLILLCSFVQSGCSSSYAWRSKVPAEMRTVAVPTFRSDADLPGVGAAMSRQLLREFQREGTFSVASAGESALEIQGVVKRVKSGSVAYSRRSGHRVNAYDMTADVEVSVVDRRGGRVLVDNRMYKARTTFTAGQDIDTAERDACGRLADDLARQVVDDVLGLEWGPAEQTE